MTQLHAPEINALAGIGVAITPITRIEAKVTHANILNQLELEKILSRFDRITKF
jgi:hypothetical protein